MRLPLYRLLFDEKNNEQHLKMSLVDAPATDSLFLKFEEDHKFQFSVINEDEQIIYGVALRADFPIYRNDNYLGEYFITFSRETIAKIQAEFLKTRKFNLQHTVDNDGLEVLESFLIDKENGICPQAFSEIEDGSWVLKVHVTDEVLWKSIKQGLFNGFSVEGYFDYSKVELSKQTNNIMSLKALKIKLAKLLLKLGTITAVKDEVQYTLEFNGPELEDGVEVFIEDENEELVHPEDGEYVIDEVKWEIKEGIARKVAETTEETTTETTEEDVVREEAAEVTTEEVTEETVTEETDVEDDIKAQIAAINSRLDEIASVIDSFMELTEKINSRVEELEAKLSKVSVQAPEKLEKEEIKESKKNNPYACLSKKN